jgi:dolichyldiphosphatase
MGYVDHLLDAVTNLPFYTLFGFLVLLFFRRELHTVSLLTGLVLNEAANKMLKNAIKQPRPATSGDSGYGMPSGHSQFTFFLAAYTLVYLGGRAKFPGASLALWSYRAAVLAISIAICASRVQLGHHTVNQVVAGVALGSCLGLGWYLIVVQKVLVEGRWFQWAESLPVCQTFLLKDSGPVDDVLRFEYNAHMAARKRSS